MWAGKQGCNVRVARVAFAVGYGSAADRRGGLHKCVKDDAFVRMRVRAHYVVHNAKQAGLPVPGTSDIFLGYF